MDAILGAIVDDDRPRVKKLLKANPGMATCPIDEPRLYQSKILHWIYAGDTALHLAAAGYRVEIVRLLLVELFTKITFYYLHERAWNRIAFGRVESPRAEYEI